LRIDAAGRTHAGRVRGNNEDAYKIEPALALYLLSDGMGGAACGEMASEFTVSEVARHCREWNANPRARAAGLLRPEYSSETNCLADAVVLANRRLFDSACGDSKRQGMGATVVGLWLSGQRVSLVHVGDSRAYLLRAGSLQQLTQDHSLIAEQVRMGAITQQESQTSTLQSVLTRAVGVDSEVEVDVEEHVLIDGDVLLLCSDGLTRMVGDAEIETHLAAAASARDAATGLVDLANAHGGADNVTVVVIRCVGGLWARLRGLGQKR
jgi:protein phosphatase